MLGRHWPYIAAAIVLAVWCLWAFQQHDFLERLGPVPPLENRGQWGDSFGALNALFSALAIIGVVFSIRYQTRQGAQQRFENTFFELLKMIRENRENVRFKYSEEAAASRNIKEASEHYGHAAFRVAYRELQFWVKQAGPTPGSLTRQGLADIYEARIHRRYESTFGTYYRMIYSVLDWVNSQDHLSQEDKNLYGNIVRSQMTSQESILAGYNGLNDFAKDFDSLIVRFRLLKYAMTGNLRKHLEHIYPKDAFEGRHYPDATSVESDLS